MTETANTVLLIYSIEITSRGGYTFPYKSDHLMYKLMNKGRCHLELNQNSKEKDRLKG